MILKVSKSALDESMSFIKVFISSCMFPNLANPIEIEAKPDCICFRGSNEFASFDIEAKADVAEPGHIAVDPNLFSKVIAKVPSGIISMKRGSEGISITSKAYTANVQMKSAVNIDEISSIICNPENMVDGVDILKAMDSVVWSLDKKLINPTGIPLDCVYLKSVDGGVDVVGSDRNVLAVKHVESEDFGLDSFLVQHKLLQLIKKMTEDDSTKIGIENNIMKIVSDRKTICCVQTSGEYLQYTQFFSQMAGAVDFIRVDSSNIVEMIKRVGILFSGKYYSINVHYEDDVLSLKSIGEGSDIEESMEVEGHGTDNFSFLGISDYLRNAIAPIEGYAYISYVDAKKPILIRTEDMEYKCMVMPIVGG